MDVIQGCKCSLSHWNDLVRFIKDLQTEANMYTQQHSLGADMFSCISEEGDICPITLQVSMSMPLVTIWLAKNVVRGKFGLGCKLKPTLEMQWGILPYAEVQPRNSNSFEFICSFCCSGWIKRCNGIHRYWRIWTAQCTSFCFHICFNSL